MEAIEGFSAEIEALEEFGFESGAWMDWDAKAWNWQLLLYCFLRDRSRSASDPMRATLEDLPLLVRDPRADPDALIQTLLLAIRAEARLHDRDPLAQLARDCRRFNPSDSAPPPFFAFLWVTCLIAQGYPSANGEGLFHQRFDLVFARADRSCLSSIPIAWDLLSQWLEHGRRFAGYRLQELSLPVVDNWRKHISHSWKLAFPSLLDRKRLQRELAQQQHQIQPLRATNPALVQALLGSAASFTPSFQEQLQLLLIALLKGEPPSAWFVELLDRELRRLASSPDGGLRSPRRSQAKPMQGFGPLLLASMDYALGVLVLAPKSGNPPDGFVVVDDAPWASGERLLAPVSPTDPDYAVFDAGSLALDPELTPVPALAPWLERGLLLFSSPTPSDRPRLVFDAAQGPITHALVHSERLETFLERFEAETVDSDEEDWHCVQLISADPADLLRFPEPGPAQSGDGTPQLRTHGGVRLAGAGYLASGLGLPGVRLESARPALKVLLLTAIGELVEYEQPAGQDDPAAKQPQLWQPTPQARQRNDLHAGPGRLVAFFAAPEPTLEVALPLSVVAARPRFQRRQTLGWRENWGLELGPLCLAPTEPPPPAPAAEAIAWARHRLNSGDARVDPRFEEQVLDSLCALFESGSSLTRKAFFELYDALQGSPQDWPRFNEAILRGWCEGGWIEEGLEQQRHRWRIQPIDPRLVRLGADRAQLVGLLPARGLVELLAHAHQLGIAIASVTPSYPRMPRGWRFQGKIEALAQAAGLPLVSRESWVPDPSSVDWVLPESLPCDGPSWPTGSAHRMGTDKICGRRGRYNHALLRLFGEEERAPNGLGIDCEQSRYGRRRWMSHDETRDRAFSSCHRNRAALHALIVATDGSWPFGITDRESGLIERLYDAEAYLPLPIGRYAALTGAQMPGPTRHQRQNHTYRYQLDAALIQSQLAYSFMPLTVFN